MAAAVESWWGWRRWWWKWCRDRDRWRSRWGGETTRPPRPRSVARPAAAAAADTGAAAERGCRAGRSPDALFVVVGFPDCALAEPRGRQPDDDDDDDHDCNQQQQFVPKQQWQRQ